jgi:hypothetical protein
MYDDAWMPHMQRITWNGIALHGGPLPGYAASHGCVRLPFGFAERLFNKTRIGMRVIIAPNDTTPIPFPTQRYWCRTRRRGRQRPREPGPSCMRRRRPPELTTKRKEPQR